MQTFRLDDDQLTIIGTIEQMWPFPEEALAAYWRYLGATMGFDPSTAATTDYGEFQAQQLDAQGVIDLGIGPAVGWREDLGGEIKGRFVRLADDTLLCWTQDVFGIYRNRDAFDDGEALISF